MGMQDFRCFRVPTSCRPRPCTPCFSNPCCRKPEVRNYFLSSESPCNDNSEKESLNVNIVLSQEDKKEENICFHMNVIGDPAGKPEEEEPEEES
ncbi:hypothetical protein CWI38_1545p0010 [Hamiltosporidium tvaerminnensis]|uniref:Uncharacterized protein n=1 Tax=Hamiltosporidium tvaerminnensis TaxID=1176355 RepID=A0A4Q9LRT8_9MICR|nr:hypothetical protein CWI38_1545p0010 [Hamiltosporidium tvaerminnensis]